MHDEITLQINLSPGDISYAMFTVPALIKKHNFIKKRLLIVDCTKPQKTKIVDPKKRFPEPHFQEKVEKIKEIAEHFKSEGLVSDVFYLTPKHPIIDKLSKKYLNSWYAHTHDYGGCANMSYWAFLELPKTKYVLHFDGDMLMYQNQNYSWVEEGISCLEKNANAIAVVPSLCPNLDDIIVSNDQWAETKNYTHYWEDGFFSTRCMLIDKERLIRFLPLMKGKILVETLAVRLLNRGYPRSPEIVMTHSVGGNGGTRLILKNQNAFLLHPLTKPTEYINLLPQIIHCIDNNNIPNEQFGYENIMLDAWVKYLAH